MPLAIYEAVASGDSQQAQILALILTAISILAVYLTNKISRSYIY
jgi:ABC-type Fe3+ transport system permease subunit